MDAISKIKDKSVLRKSSLWSVRWKLNEEGRYVLANAKPCVYCRDLARKNGIKTVFYSNEEGTISRASTDNIECQLTAASAIHLRVSKGYKHVSYKRKLLNSSWN